MLLLNLLKFLSYFSLFNLQIIFLISWFLINLVWFFRQKNFFVLIFLLFLNLTFGTLLGFKVWSNKVEISTINVQRVPVFIGPDKDFHVIGFLNLKDEIIILEKQNLWYKIKASNLSGWIYSEDLMVT